MQSFLPSIVSMPVGTLFEKVDCILKQGLLEEEHTLLFETLSQRLKMNEIETVRSLKGVVTDRLNAARDAEEAAREHENLVRRMCGLPA
jgi:hypothetical protein